MKCNGCGGVFDIVAGTLSYGNIQCLDHDEGDDTRRAVSADHHKTLCPRCKHVMFDILQSSDLKDQWGEYEWSLVGNVYTEGYGEGDD